MSDPNTPVPPGQQDRRRHAPAAERNRDALLKVFRDVIPARARILEIASGTGQHAIHIAGYLGRLDWTPSDPDPLARESITAWVDALGARNVRSPLDIDVHTERWADFDEGALDVIVCINMIHIAPWSACEALMRGAGRYLREEGLLFLYGPFKREGRHTAPSNESFDFSLRAQDPCWGVRDLGDVEAAAETCGLVRHHVIDMPANNLSVLFRKEETAGA